MTLTQEVKDRHNRAMVKLIREHLETIDHLLRMMQIPEEKSELS